jgi:uncharacterized SAM-binding protein YcdF (DUF218 family)
MPNMKRAAKIGGLIVGILVAIVLAGYLFIFAQIFLYSTNDQTRQADAAIILGSSAIHDVPSLRFKERIKQGILLYEDHTVQKLIFTGGKTGGNDIAEAEVGKTYALGKGVPDEDILLETESVSTLTNLINSKEILTKNNLQSVLIVTDPLHEFRAMAMAKDLGIDAYSSPTKTSTIKTLKDRLEFTNGEVKKYLSYKYPQLFH